MTSPHPRYDAVIVGARAADLAERLAAHGPGAVERELQRFVEHARRQGVTPVLLGVLADPDQPDVARERAFGRIAVELEHPSERRPTRRLLSPNAA